MRANGQAAVDWDGYREHLLRAYSRRVALERYSYARQYAHCLLDGNLGELKALTDDKRVHVQKALSSLSKYLGAYEEFRQLTRNYGLKWSGRARDQLIISRLTKVSDPGDVFRYVREVKRRAPELDAFMDLDAITGMRLVEAAQGYNLIIRLSRDGRLGEYYDNGILQHYRFPDLFIRRTKKAFISFVPADVVDAVKERRALTADNALKMIQLRGLPCRFGDIREAHASFLTRFLTPPEIDFLQGRIGTTVFMQNYFNPKLVSDLKERVLKAVAALRENL